MMRFAESSLLLVTLAGCSAPIKPGTAGVAPPSCPTAREIWPSLDWSDAIGERLTLQLAQAFLGSEWLNGHRRGRRRIRLGGLQNRTDYRVSRQHVFMVMQQRLMDSGKVTLVAGIDEGASLDAKKPQPDAELWVRIESVLYDKGTARISGFSAELKVVTPGQRPELSSLWKTGARVVRTLTPATRPPSCPEPPWLCSQTANRIAEDEKSCSAQWHCAQGTFAILCDRQICRCHRAPVARPGELVTGAAGDRTVRVPDLCSAPSRLYQEKARQAANQFCGFNLPAR